MEWHETALKTLRSRNDFDHLVTFGCAMTCTFSASCRYQPLKPTLSAEKPITWSPSRQRAGESDVGLALLEDFAEVDLDPVESFESQQSCDAQRSWEARGEWGCPREAMSNGADD